MRVLFSWLKDYVDIRLTPDELAQKLTMAGLEVTSLSKVDDDAVMEIEITPNRTDCLNMVGIAREVAAFTGKTLKAPKISSIRGISSLAVPITVQDKKLCPCYLGRVIKNVTVGPSPQWLKDRLEMMGVRSVNNIVDITNFCLLELGQPLHAFDLDKLEGERLVVRPALKDEEIITIDGSARTLTTNMLVIADKVRAQAIAGIMGSKMSEVGDVTTRILLESAYFDPMSIGRTSRKLSLATQSSYRFERGVDIAAVHYTSLRAIDLIRKYAKASKKKAKAIAVGKLIVKGKKSVFSVKVKLRFKEVQECLGMAVTPAQIKDILRRLSLAIVRKSKEFVVVDVPSFRPDITREVDLVEEVARSVGYDATPLRLNQLIPDLSTTGKLELPQRHTFDEIRQILASLGAQEIMTYSLVSRQALKKLASPFENVIAVKNPLSYEQEVLRPTLLAGMLNSLLTNINRKNIDLKLFELSRVYVRKDTNNGIDEDTRLSIGVCGKKSESWIEKTHEYSFFDLKGIVELLLERLGVRQYSFIPERIENFTPGRCAQLKIGNDVIGVLGEIAKKVQNQFDVSRTAHIAELQLSALLPHIKKKKRFIPLARYPSLDRDISLIASQDVRSEEIVSLIKEMGRGLVEKVALFDQYFGEQISHGFRGLAYSIHYRSKEKTLTAEEVDTMHAGIRQALVDTFKVQIR